MQQKQDQADHQDNVNETCGYMKCEKSKQPENNQNRGDYPKHSFSFLPVTSTTEISILRTA
jgi:hypothetical protein